METTPIRTEAEYEAALAEIEALWGAPFGSPEGQLRAAHRGRPARHDSAARTGRLDFRGGQALWKVMQAFGKWPTERRTPVIERAIQQGVDFLLDTDPAEATYPTGFSDKPSGNWWKFGFPVFYVTDILQIAEALVTLGHAGDPRLARALALIRDKQDAQGRWLLEYDYAGKTWIDLGPKKQPNKWVTLRALRVLKDSIQSKYCEGAGNG